MPNVTEKSEEELPKTLGECICDLSQFLKEKSESIKYYGDISDFGNEVGYAVGHIIKDMSEQQITDFIHGLRHGISLTNGTH